jgi:hypothetical protein
MKGDTKEAGLGIYTGDQPTWSYIDPTQPAKGVKAAFKNGIHYPSLPNYLGDSYKVDMIMVQVHHVGWVVNNLVILIFSSDAL